MFKQTNRAQYTRHTAPARTTKISKHKYNLHTYKQVQMSVFRIYIDNNIQFSSYVQVKLSKYMNKYSVKYVIDWLMDKV